MPEEPPRGGRADRLSLLIFVCFFLSGLTGLIYEVLWTRLITRIIGGAPFAVAIVLTVFMGGLGVGSWLAGRSIDRIREPSRLVRLYGLLELVVGGCALAIPLLLLAVRPLCAVLYNYLYEHFLIYNVLLFLISALLLCAPVICMGATLPILCRFCIRHLSHLGARAGRLYGLNTAGAAVGALLAGFWLIRLLGMTGTLVLAVAVNAAIGLSCLAAARWARSREDDREPAPEPSGVLPAPFSPGAVRAALVIFGVSGFCSMALQVIWTKLLVLIVGPTTYSFTIVLVTFILGLALGSILFGWLADRTRSPVGLLVGSQLAAALLALGLSHLLGNSQLFFAKLIAAYSDQFALRTFLKGLALFLFLLPPTLCLGATFPLVSKICTPSPGRVGRTIAVAYAVNTAGAVLGSFCAGFVLVPLAGKETGVRLIVALQLLVPALLAFTLLRKSAAPRRWIPVAVPALAGLLLCARLPDWDRLHLSRGKYHRFNEFEGEMSASGWLEALVNGRAILNRTPQGALLFHGDGIGGFACVLRTSDPFGKFKYTLTVAGKPDASSDRDMATQALLAHFPMVFHGDARSVMVLGLGSGVTAGETLCYPLDSLDVLEISEQVAEANRFFHPWNRKVLEDPRTNLILQDAYAHLLLTRRKYDVIISEPSNPWMAGLASLFTCEFFQLVRDRLNENGIFTQWFHSYQMDWDSFAMVGRTFAHVFPNSLLVAAGPTRSSQDFLLIGLKGRESIRLAVAKERLAYARKSENIRIPDARILHRLVLCEDLVSFFGPGPLHTDDHPRLEFTAPVLMFSGGGEITRRIAKHARLGPEVRRTIEEITGNIEAQISFAEFAMSLQSPSPGTVDMTEATPEQKERLLRLRENYYHRRPLQHAVLEDPDLLKRLVADQIRFLEDNVAHLPNKALSYTYLADLYFRSDRMLEAADAYLEAMKYRPGGAYVHHHLALSLAAMGRIDEAIPHYRKALRLAPEYADLRNNLGFALALQGKHEEAIEHYAVALRVAPDFINAHFNMGVSLVHRGVLDDAAYHFREALRLRPDFTHAREYLDKVLRMMNERGIPH